MSRLMINSYVAVFLGTPTGLSSVCFFFSSRRRHTRCLSDWSSDVCSSDLGRRIRAVAGATERRFWFANIRSSRRFGNVGLQVLIEGLQVALVRRTNPASVGDRKSVV